MQCADSARRMTNQESKEGARTLQVPAAFTTSLTSTLFLLQMAQARHSKSRAGSRARVPQVQSSKDQFHREWCSSSQTSEDHKGPSQQGREILCSSGYQIESYQLLHKAKQLCVKHSAQSKISQPVSPDHRRLTLPPRAWQFQAPVLFEDGGSSGGVLFLSFSWILPPRLQVEQLGSLADTAAGMVARLILLPHKKFLLRKKWKFECPTALDILQLPHSMSASFLPLFFVSWH